MCYGELDAREPPQVEFSRFQMKGRSRRSLGNLLEFFGFIGKRLSGMDGLHPQDLVVTLLVIEH